MTSVLLATNEPVLAKGLEMILVAAGLQISDVCTDIADLIRAFRRSPPDIAILDLPLSLELAVIGDLRKLARNCQIVVWSRQLSKAQANEAIRLGANAVLPAVLPPDRLIEALQLLACFPEPEAPATLVSRICNPTEQHLLSLVACGLKNREIAALMRFDQVSVENLMRSVSSRLGAVDRYELALYGLSTVKEAYNAKGE
jgi:DNA-binding NarL/FixJ family response regulator